jgi:hypothetical protein
MRKITTTAALMMAVTLAARAEPLVATPPPTPAPPMEAMHLAPPPGPETAFMVEPAHWEWSAGKYIWIRHHWVAADPTHKRFVSGNWRHEPGGYRWVKAYWTK